MFRLLAPDCCLEADLGLFFAAINLSGLVSLVRGSIGCGDSRAAAITGGFGPGASLGGAVFG